jgi:hypothetical protein
MRTLTRFAVLALPGLVLGSSPLSAQSALRPIAGVYLERYTFKQPEAIDIESLTLWTVPFGAEMAAGPNVLFSVSGSYARAVLSRPDGSEASLDGLTDSEISARVATPDGAASVTAIVQLPTGSSRLSGDGLFAAGAIAADLLPFRITNWGTGGGAGLSAAVARPLGSFVVGASVGYVVARSFEPLDAQDFRYRPGNQFQVQAAIDRTIGRSAKAAVKVGWNRYGTDKGDGQNLFQTGDRLRVVGSLDFAIGQSKAIAYAGWLSRGEGEFAGATDLLPAQRLGYGGFGFRKSIGSAVLQPSLDVRVLDTDGADRHGYTAGLGAALELPLSGTIVAPSVRGRLGRIQAQDGAESTYNGIEMGLAVRFGARK